MQKGFISPAEPRQGAVHRARRGGSHPYRRGAGQVRGRAGRERGRDGQQREAALASARNDLAKTAITAPVNGVVISRQVDAGQTVAASLNTPTLFTIAEDLAKGQVAVAIDETDIAIRPDMRVTFTVDAHPGAPSKAGSTRYGNPRRRCRTSSPTR